MYYYLALLFLAAPISILTIVKQHSGGNQNLGCDSSFEKLGDWYEVLATEILPICIGFFFNVFVCARVYGKMASKAYPLSVRKRRRRIMYHYSIVCVVCWSPTIIFYFMQVGGIYNFYFALFTRATLYLTGFFNFLIFGRQDPHLRKSFDYVLYVACQCTSQNSMLIDKDVQKSVMFDEAAIISESRKMKRLSVSDKIVLYKNRPDLDPTNSLDEPLLVHSPSGHDIRSFSVVESKDQGKADNSASILEFYEGTYKFETF